jgi:Arc/MetJ family transcription regulator
MATNLAIDDRLLNEALRIGGRKTKKATVTEALEEYIQRCEQLRIPTTSQSLPPDDSSRGPVSKA